MAARGTGPRPQAAHQEWPRLQVRRVPGVGECSTPGTAPRAPSPMCWVMPQLPVAAARVWWFLTSPPSAPSQEFDKLSDFFKAHYCLELVEKDLCVKGWNWGTVRFGGESCGRAPTPVAVPAVPQAATRLLGVSWDQWGWWQDGAWESRRWKIQGRQGRGFHAAGNVLYKRESWGGSCEVWPLPGGAMGAGGSALGLRPGEDGNRWFLPVPA